jgi:ABC-type sulfate transport system substrate-binding protein
MKNFLFLYCILALVIFSSDLIYSQQTQANGNIFHVATFKVEMPEGGSWAEFDSLSALLTNNVTKKDNKIVSQRILRHLWGNSSRDLVVITEYRNIDDLVHENKDGDALFAAHWKSDAERQAFNKSFNKYFAGEHSDEIYQEMKSGRK